MKELMVESIDVQDFSPIDVLIGADVADKLYMGGKLTLCCGLVEIERLVGWTLLKNIDSYKR